MYAGCIHPYPAVRLRGLPFASSREEIADFLEVRPIDIVFQERGGRPNGVAFVLLSSSDDYQQCLDKDKQNLGSRYIEVFPCARSVRAGLLLSWSAMCVILSECSVFGCLAIGRTRACQSATMWSRSQFSERA